MIKKEKEKRKLEVEKGNLGWGKNPGIGIINTSLCARAQRLFYFLGKD